MNWPLRIGIVGTLLLLFIVLAGPLMAPYSMDDFSKYKTVQTELGEMKTIAPPYPPSQEHLLGTDRVGRDMLSILLRGARVTLLFAAGVATISMLLALPLSLAGVSYPRTVGWLIEKASMAATTVPMVLVVVMVAGIYRFSPLLSISQNLLITGMLLVAVGLFQNAHLLQTRINTILKYPFMEGVRSIGAGKVKAFRKHVVPHLSIHLGVLYVTEIANTLWIIAQLGLLSVFLGGALLEAIPGLPPAARIPEEWAGRLGASYGLFRSYPMLVLYPALAISFAVLSFNLLADGIRKYNERKWGIEFK